MRKITALLMVFVTLFAFTSCTYTVKDEDKAVQVYTCPSNNMFGLEKIVVFEDGITMVFDKLKCDMSKHIDLKKIEPGDDLYGAYLDLHEYLYYYYEPRTKNSFLVKRGKYVASAFYYDDEVKAEFEEEGFVIGGMDICGKHIDFKDGIITLSYEDREDIYDAYWLIKQQFDPSTGKWGEIKKETVSAWSE